MSDTVDLDIDLDNLDYGDFDDINPDDLDIDNLERELGLVSDNPKEEAANDKTTSNTSEPSLKEHSKDTSKDANAEATLSETPSTAKTPTSPKKIAPLTSNSPSKTEDVTSNNQSKPSSSPARHQQGTNGNQQQYNPRMNRSKHPMSSQHHHPFNPGMMNINMMMMMQAQAPRFPPHLGFPTGFPGKAIHINPKFAAKHPDLFNGPPTSAPVETSSMSLPTATTTTTPSQDALQRQREYILEQQRKRRERKAAEMNTSGSMDAGQKRTADNDNEHASKRPFAIKGMGVKGISIKGAAAAAAAAVSTPPSSSNSPVRSPAGTTPSILSRINNHTRQQGQKRSAQDDINQQYPKRPASNETVSSLQKQPTTPSSPIPISTTGKSSKLVISNLSDTVTVEEIRELGQTIQGGIKDIDIDRETQKANVVFNNAEAAVIFRRKYNRSLLGGNHIQVSFAVQ